MDIINFFNDISYSGVLESGEVISTDEALMKIFESSFHTNGIFSSTS